MRWILFVLLTVNLVHARPTPNTDSVLLLNSTTQKIELERNGDRVRAIASITKIMTAMVALDYDKDLSRRLTLTRRVGSYLPRQQYTREQLLEAMLVKSDNGAAEKCCITKFLGLWSSPCKAHTVNLNQKAACSLKPINDILSRIADTAHKVK